jgi:hypothetical protein
VKIWCYIRFQYPKVSRTSFTSLTSLHVSHSLDYWVQKKKWHFAGLLWHNVCTRFCVNGSSGSEIWMLGHTQTHTSGLISIILMWSEVSYGEVLVDKGAMYIRVTLYWGYLIMNLFIPVCIIYICILVRPTHLYCLVLNWLHVSALMGHHQVVEILV